MRHFLPILAILAVFGTAACSSHPEFSESLYKSTEVGIAKTVLRCRVLAVREITIREADNDESGQIIGAIAGGILGSALGGTVGGDANDQELGEAVGGVGGVIAGAVIGEQVGEAYGRRKGLEYSILTSEGEEITFAQEFLEGDRVVAPGETCRLQVSGRTNRVLPITGVLKSVDLPEESTFN